MTYFDAKTVERVKRFSLVDLLSRDGLVLKKQGKDYFTCCPFHNDKTPSLSVTPDKNLWHCLGACQTGGSPIDYVMRRDGVSFKTAVSTLLEEHGEPPTPVLTKPLHPKAKDILDSLEARQSDEGQQWLTRTIDLYQKNLAQSTQAKAYLAQRGLDNEALISTFKLGYAQKKPRQYLTYAHLPSGQRHSRTA